MFMNVAVESLLLSWLFFWLFYRDCVAKNVLLGADILYCVFYSLIGPVFFFIVKNQFLV